MPSTCAFMSSSMRRTSACSMIGTRGAVASFQCLIERALLAVLRVLERVEVRGRRDREALHADGDARAVHQVEHLRHALLLDASPTSSPMHSSFSPKSSTRSPSR